MNRVTGTGNKSDPIILQQALDAFEQGTTLFEQASKDIKDHGVGTDGTDSNRQDLHADVSVFISGYHGHQSVNHPEPKTNQGYYQTPQPAEDPGKTASTQFGKGTGSESFAAVSRRHRQDIKYGRTVKGELEQSGQAVRWDGDR
jgi:hypothetical protein